jgi:hypothetical protein
VNRWYAIFASQHTLPAMAACENGTTRRVFDEQLSKPATPGGAPSA